MTPTPTTPPATPRRPRWLLAVAGVLAVVLVAGGVVSVLMYLKVRDQHRLDDDRRDALTAAEQFALRMDAFDGANLDAYVKSVEPMLTTKEKAEFTKQLGQFRQVYEQAQKAAKQKGSTTDQPAGTGKIQLAGVTDVDEDSATVLVAHDTTSAGATEALHSRWTVSMRKIDGRWLVDSFVPVS